MNHFHKITLVSLCLIFAVKSFAQDEAYYERLFYTCKAWGHVKYYHTETANGSVAWDDVLINSIEDIKNASNDDEFNTALMNMINEAGELGTNFGVLPPLPDSLNNNLDLSWIDEEILSAEVGESLKEMRDFFKPQSNIYVGEAWAGGNPTFDTDNQYSSEGGYISEELRILALFRYWNIINYFFPYKYIMDQSWDDSLREFIDDIVGAPDALSYHLAFKELTTRINDSHAFFGSPSYNQWNGNAYTPFHSRWIEDKMVITEVVPSVTNIKPGDIIMEIDGHEIAELRDSLRRYSHGSNDVILEREINWLISIGPVGNFDIKVDNGQEIVSASLNRNGSNYSILESDDTEIWNVMTTAEGCEYGVIDMGRLEGNDIQSMFDDLWETDALIFDIRNYPNGTLWDLVNYLYPSFINIANFTVPDIRFPGRRYWINANIGYGTTNIYPGKLIILFDERTQSQAEYTVMGLEQFPDAIKIGSTTSAADGNVAPITLPGQITTYATFLGTYYPDYSPTQRIGILPDYEVKPTIEGIREGRDELMEFATQCQLVSTKEEVLAAQIDVFPNPTTGILHVTFQNELIEKLELFDVQGRMIIANTESGFSSELDLSGLTDGVYVVKVFSSQGVKSQIVIKE